MMYAENRLDFDPEKARSDIVDLIRAQVKRFNKAGAMVVLSGGLDSSTVAVLCVEALGKDRVAGLILPERDSAPGNTKDAIDLATRLGIQYRMIDISPVLESIGAYDIFPKELTSSRSAMESSIDQVRQGTGEKSIFAASFSSIYLPGRVVDDDYNFVSRMHAFMTAKIRARMMTIYFNAILMNYLVVGTDDLSELTIGFYDKYGDGACDISVLSHLYKTQIKRLAAHIGVPEHIVNKPSSHDLWGEGMPNEMTIGLPYDKLDMILRDLEDGLGDREIARMTGVSLQAVRSVKDCVESEKVRRCMPINVDTEREKE